MTVSFFVLNNPIRHDFKLYMPDSNLPQYSSHLSSNQSESSAIKPISEPTVKPVGLQHYGAAATPWYYQLIIKLAKPLYRMSLWRRHQKAKKDGIPIADYQTEIEARFGHAYPSPPILSKQRSEDIAQNEHSYLAVMGTSPIIWCHAVSLGETNTIAPMLKIMLKKGARIWLTNTTQTGYARAEALFSSAILSRQLVHTFVPTDDKKIIRKFIQHVRPDLAMFVETELWSNILTELATLNIPSVLVNARLSQKSFKSYQKFNAVSESMMKNLSMIITQDVDSAKRFRQLGASAAKIRRAASLKWSSGTQLDSSLSKHNKTFIDSITQDERVLRRPIWVAGSTHDGEEQIVLQVHQKLMQTAALQDALLILVPRHPERFDSVADMIEAANLRVARRSKNTLIDTTTQVYLADTMGELEQFYQISDVCFVGGSLVNIGGHNPIEAAVFGKPVIMGPYTQSCQELVTSLQEVGALEVVNGASDTSDNKSNKTASNGDVTELMCTVLSDWLNHTNKAKEAGGKGKALVLEKDNALQTQLTMIEQLLFSTYRTKLFADEVTDIEINHSDLSI